MNPVRVRFAPSPTGHFHMGGARTALYNFLLAKQTGGQFILRLEDTDLARSKPEYEEELKDALRWLGIHWDEGPDIGGPHAPYNQTGRKALYLKYANQLIESGHAYRCFCTSERLKEVRETQQKLKQPTRYDGTCRRLSVDESNARAAAGEKCVIRFKMPQDGTTTAVDKLRGPITVENTQFDDAIIVRSDGFALYHLAAMVDDYEMGITHVFRGQEWLGTFPLHVNIIRAFGWPEPVWCHLSVFLNPSGKGKMSKRNLKSEQAIFVLEMRDQGYIPEAVNAWIALMGASFGAEEELLTLEEMAQRFSIDHLNPSASRVNFEKLDDFNGKWIRRLSPDDLASRVQPFFTKAGYTTDIETLRKIAPLIQERIVTLDDAVEMAGFFFKPEIALKRDDLIGKGLDAAQSAAALTRALALFTAAPDFAHATLETPMRALAEELGMKPGLLFGMVRSAVTGQTVSPPLFECMEVIGRATCLARMQKAIDLLG